MKRKEDKKDHSEIPLFGLVLAGGESKRMNRDKSLLEYHGKSQIKYCFDILLEFCEQVFLSNRKEQLNLPEYKSYPQIHDTYTNVGPLDGILSAMKRYPHTAWLVLACDLPFIDSDVLKTLIRKRNALKMATAYQSSHNDSPEPLCAIYEPKSFPILKKFFEEKCYCPRKILVNSDIELIQQEIKTSLENINTPNEYREAQKNIKQI